MHNYVGVFKEALEKKVKEPFANFVKTIPLLSGLGYRPDQDKQEKIKILLIDDNWRYREFIRTLIEEEGDLVIVGEASDGQEAVQIAHEVQPDVIIMDINMPRMSGIEATRKITDDLPNIAIIGLSANTKDKVIEDVKNAGAAVYIQKSQAHKSLVKTIRSDEIPK